MLGTQSRTYGDGVAEGKGRETAAFAEHTDKEDHQTETIVIDCQPIAEIAKAKAGEAIQIKLLSPSLNRR